MLNAVSKYWVRGLRAPMTKTAVELGIALLLALAASKLFWLLFAPLPTPKGVPVITPQQSASVENRAVNPFFVAESAASSGEEAVMAETLAETSLDLILYGTWPHETGSTAFIDAGNGSQKRYRTGDQIVSGARLGPVYENWVVIRRGGVDEALWIKDRKQSEIEAVVVAAQPQSGSETPAEQATEKAPDILETLSDIVSFSVSGLSNGELRIVLNPGANVQRFNELGFVAGDVLTALNNAPINPEQIMSGAFQEGLAADAPIDIMVERDGRPVSLTIQLNAKASEESNEDDS